MFDIFRLERVAPHDSGGAALFSAAGGMSRGASMAMNAGDSSMEEVGGAGSSSVRGSKAKRTRADASSTSTSNENSATGDGTADWSSTEQVPIIEVTGIHISADGNVDVDPFTHDSDWSDYGDDEDPGELACMHVWLYVCLYVYLYVCMYV